MTTWQQSLTLDQPHEAFAALTDFERLPSLVPDLVRMEIVGEGPCGLGTVVRETRRMYGKEATESFEVVDWQEGACTVRYHYLGLLIDFTTALGPMASQLTLTVAVTGQGLKKLAEGMTARYMGRAWLKDVEHVRTAVEQANPTVI